MATKGHYNGLCHAKCNVPQTDMYIQRMLWSVPEADPLVWRNLAAAVKQLSQTYAQRAVAHLGDKSS